MSIDLTKDPYDLFAGLIQKKNTALPELTASDISVRRITATGDTALSTSAEVDLLIEPSEAYGDFVEFTYNRIPVNVLFNNVDTILDDTHTDYWDKAAVSTWDSGSQYDDDSIPSATLVAPTPTYNVSRGNFVLKKEFVFTTNLIKVVVRTDDYSSLYIDGKWIGRTEVPWRTPTTIEATVTPGEHTVALHAANNSGPCQTSFAIYDGEDLIIDSSDSSWPLKEIVDDMVAADYTKPYVPDNVELEYDLSELSMLTDSISNGAAIYDNWYRFSHSTAHIFPANTTELDGWSYDAENDCIVSTINSDTHVGFISDITSDNYIFNTVFTSNNADNDNVNIVLAAKKLGEIDDEEHVLTVNVNTGGVVHKVAVYEDFVNAWGDADNNGPVIALMDATAQSGVGWKAYYSHVYAERIGDVIKVWVKQYTDDTLSGLSDATRTPIIKGHIDDLALLTESDFTALNYLYAEIDLVTQSPMFVGPCYYGYSQFSQAGAHFWNIQRPNETPDSTPALHAHLLRRYGVNFGGTGMTVASLGNNSYQIDVDSVTYLGSFTMNPKTDDEE